MSVRWKFGVGGRVKYHTGWENSIEIFEKTVLDYNEEKRQKDSIRQEWQ